MLDSVGPKIQTWQLLGPSNNLLPELYFKDLDGYQWRNTSIPISLYREGMMGSRKYIETFLDTEPSYHQVPSKPIYSKYRETTCFGESQKGIWRQIDWDWIRGPAVSRSDKLWQVIYLLHNKLFVWTYLLICKRELIMISLKNLAKVKNNAQSFTFSRGWISRRFYSNQLLMISCLFSVPNDLFLSFIQPSGSLPSFCDLKFALIYCLRTSPVWTTGSWRLSEEGGHKFCGVVVI